MMLFGERNSEHTTWQVAVAWCDLRDDDDDDDDYDDDILPQM
jgi:hypothetical protein